MDNETRKEFTKVNSTLVDINTSIKESHAYNKGLNLKNRVEKIEYNLPKKASWKGLYLMTVVVLAFVTAVVAVAKLF